MPDFIEFIENARTLLKEKYGCSRFLEETAKMYRLSDIITIEDDHLYKFFREAGNFDKIACGVTDRREVYNGYTPDTSMEARKKMQKRHAGCIFEIASLDPEKYTEQDKVELIIAYVFCSHITQLLSDMYQHQKFTDSDGRLPSHNPQDTFDRFKLRHLDYKGPDSKAFEKLNWCYVYANTTVFERMLAKDFSIAFMHHANTKNFSVFTDDLGWTLENLFDQIAEEFKRNVIYTYDLDTLASEIFCMEKVYDLKCSLSYDQDRYDTAKSNYERYKKPEYKEKYKAEMEKYHTEIKKYQKELKPIQEKGEECREKLEKNLRYTVENIFYHYVKMLPAVLFRNEILVCQMEVPKWRYEWPPAAEDAWLRDFSQKLYRKQKEQEKEQESLEEDLER